MAVIENLTLHDHRDMARPILAGVGCGPKMLALAAKAKVLDDLGLPSVDVVIFESQEVAAHWDGQNGFTNGKFQLGTPPEKDLGFPYASRFGREVDKGLIAYSWPAFLIDQGQYGDWVDRGRIHPTHRRWAEYLRWAHDQIAPHVVLGHVTAIRPNRRGFGIVIENQKHDYLVADGVVFTGPGEPARIESCKHEWTERILNGRNFWQRLDLFAGMANRRVAVIGGGETAASIVIALLDHMPSIHIDLINRRGMVYTRGESYRENHVFSDPSGWPERPRDERLEIIARTDRGVFSSESEKIIDKVENITLRSGNVIELTERRGEVLVKLQPNTFNTESKIYEYDKVIVAIGFDPLSSLRMLPTHLTPRKEITQLRYDIDHHLRINLPSLGRVNIHVPMLAGFAQGPGFPNLSCLGTMSDRIISTYIDDQAKLMSVQPKISVGL